MKHKHVHDKQRTFRIMITSATTACNIRPIVETIITSHTGTAYYVEHYAQTHAAAWRFQSIDQCWAHLQSIIPECIAYAPVAEIFASVQIPALFTAK